MTVNPWAYVDGTSEAARFNTPSGLVSDRSGNVYVADSSNHVIRKIAANGVVSTLAGSGTAGSADGKGSAASFNSPVALALDSVGSLWVVDQANQTIRKISPDGTVSTLAGLAGNAGNTDGQGSSARFAALRDAAVSPSGDLYVLEEHSLRKVTSAGQVSTLWRGTDTLMGIAVDSASTVYVSSATESTPGFTYYYNDQKISKINAAGQWTTLTAPVGTFTTVQRSSGRFGALSVDSNDQLYGLVFGEQRRSTVAKISPTGTVTELYAAPTAPQKLTVSANGRVLVTDLHAVVEARATGLAVVAGSDTTSYTTPGPFSNPQAMAADPAGNLWVTNQAGRTLVKVNAKAEVSVAQATGMSYPTGVATDCQGNTFVVDSFANVIYRYSSAGVFSEAVGINKIGASLLAMVAVAADCSGNLYTTNAWINNVIKVAADGTASTLAGPPLSVPLTRPIPTGTADGVGANARFNGPRALAVDAAGNVHVADTTNHTVRKVSPEGVVTTLAGKAGVAGSADGQGTAASFSGPSALSFDSAGNLYVLDAGNNLVRRITPSGLVSTVAGTRGATALQLGALPGAWVNSVGLTVSGHRIYVLADHAILTLPLP
ncbi:hypothetical protein PSQ20_18350 [Curvibacter sp. RS43]|uniref:hypothetical protein n=1 Tax=Curvibacter microcysteis TaxID=3026419 RepID=UPI00235E046A|nr:hypothetical protein [Curvibacter sp. RS43]MDD0812318.1 hypothetical protein [Curvibacter sp. RS43]